MSDILSVEMWCRRQAVAAILNLLVAGFLFGESSEALTTFGKSNTLPPYQPPTATLPPARQCQRQVDCAGIMGTSCVRTAFDSASRCLCGDNRPPSNGRCEANLKGLYHTCADTADCYDDGLICTTPNTTATQNSGSNSNSNSGNGNQYSNSGNGNQNRGSWSGQQQQSEKLCLCDEENGYTEHNYACNDAPRPEFHAHLLMIPTIAAVYLINSCLIY